MVSKRIKWESIQKAEDKGQKTELGCVVDCWCFDFNVHASELFSHWHCAFFVGVDLRSAKVGISDVEVCSFDC